MKLMKKLRKRWIQWRFYRSNPELAKLHNVVRAAIEQGKQNPVGRARRGRE